MVAQRALKNSTSRGNRIVQLLPEGGAARVWARGWARWLSACVGIAHPATPTLLKGSDARMPDGMAAPEDANVLDVLLSRQAPPDEPPTHPPDEPQADEPQRTAAKRKRVRTRRTLLHTLLHTAFAGSTRAPFTQVRTGCCFAGTKCGGPREAQRDEEEQAGECPRCTRGDWRTTPS